MDQTTSFFTEHYDKITIVILSIFLGIEIIGRVPSVLHTPADERRQRHTWCGGDRSDHHYGEAEHDNYLALILGFLAVVLGTLNVVGGFVVTDRMLEMFKKKKPK